LFFTVSLAALSCLVLLEVPNLQEAVFSEEGVSLAFQGDRETDRRAERK
jgi:hypothetical protein